MRPKTLSIAPYATSDPDGISLSQTPAAGGVQELTIDGAFAVSGVATLDTSRQVLITSAGDDTGVVFVVTGADSKGRQLIEAVQGVNATTVATVRAFLTVTSVKVNANTGGAVQVGTQTTVSTNWLPLDYLQETFQVGLAVIVGGAGTPDFDVEFTLDNILDYQGNSPVPGRGQHVGSVFDRFFPSHTVLPHASLVAVAADAAGEITSPVRAVRLTSTQVFTNNSVSLNVVQSHHGP